MDVKILLTLVAAVESNSGTMLNHPIIRAPASIHYQTAAIGPYAMMPLTLKALKTSDPEKGAKRLAGRITRKTPCPYEALILWERGPNHHITAKDWSRAKGRTERALTVFSLVRRSPAAGKCFFYVNADAFSGPTSLPRNKCHTVPTKH